MSVSDLARNAREMSSKMVFERRPAANGDVTTNGHHAATANGDCDCDDDNSSSASKKIRIIHFNDVYNIESSSLEPKAGAARFLTAVNYLRAEAPSIVFFSGDAFSPSSRNYLFHFAFLYLSLAKQKVHFNLNI